VRQRIPDLSAATSAGSPRVAGKVGAGDSLKGAGLPKLDTTKGPAGSPNISDLRQRIRDVSSPKSVDTPRLTGKAGVGDAVKGAALPKIDAAKGAAGSPRISDLRKRIPDIAGSKSGDKPGLTGKVGAGDAVKGAGLPKLDTAKGAGLPKLDTAKGAGLPKLDTTKGAGLPKLDTAKGPSGRPKISDIRKRIPDFSAGKGGPAAKGGLDTAKIPGKGKVERGTLPEGLGKSGDLKLAGPKSKPSMKVVGPDRLGPAGKGKPGGPAAVRPAFAERVKKGDFDTLAKGAVAQKIKLADQYRFAQQGDVARRMALHKHVTNVTNITNISKVTNINAMHGAFYPHPLYHFRGWIGPSYFHHSFRHHFYFGPSWYPRYCWYPRWVPWVRWSWYFHCPVWWDPRPIWCRPYRYVVVTRPWVYWEVPVWTALPSVPSGTWVDVEKVVVPDEQFDLQLLAVRFVDPGHPDEKLGPRYRVWVRNNSNQALSKPFDVLVMGTETEQLAQGALQAGVRVTSIQPGETQSVDIRLPFEATQMAKDAEGKPVPFKYLQVLVDANREINDVSRANNGARLTPADVLPVDPAAFELDPSTVAAGGEVVLAGEGFGPEPGKVLVHLGGIEMEAEILGWYDLGVRLKMPELPLADATKAELVVLRGDGAAANPLEITVNPPERPAPDVNAPALPVPQINPPAAPKPGL